MVKEYDLVVIGTGVTGSTVALECSSAGLKTAIVDTQPFGGTCALRGCDPKKVLVGNTEIIERSQHMQEEEAKKHGLNYTKNYQDTSTWYTSRRIGMRHSGFKILVDKDSNRILGAHLLGDNAEEVINIFALARKASLGLEDIRDMVWAYPTSSSEVRYIL